MLCAIEAAPFIERRQSPREPVEGWGLVAIPAGDQPGELVPVDFVNAGDSGIGARCKRQLPVGRAYEILGGPDEVVAAHGSIIRCEPTGDGDWFIGFSRADTLARRAAA